MDTCCDCGGDFFPQDDFDVRCEDCRWYDDDAVAECAECGDEYESDGESRYCESCLEDAA